MLAKIGFGLCVTGLVALVAGGVVVAAILAGWGAFAIHVSNGR